MAPAQFDLSLAEVRFGRPARARGPRGASARFESPCGDRPVVNYVAAAVRAPARRDGRAPSCWSSTGAPAGRSRRTSRVSASPSRPPRRLGAARASADRRSASTRPRIGLAPALCDLPTQGGLARRRRDPLGAEPRCSRSRGSAPQRRSRRPMTWSVGDRMNRRSGRRSARPRPRRANPAAHRRSAARRTRSAPHRRAPPCPAARSRAPRRAHRVGGRHACPLGPRRSPARRLAATACEPGLGSGEPTRVAASTTGQRRP